MTLDEVTQKKALRKH